jgi:hypothetical protein
VKRFVWLAPVGVLLGILALVAVPAAGLPKERPTGTAPAVLSHLSQGVQARYYLAHPEQAPESLRGRFEAARRSLDAAARGESAGAAQAGPVSDLFNDDDTGFPQNEESVTACKGRDVVVEGTNDYRGILDPQGNFTGWHYSDNGGRSITKEGLLPTIDADGEELPSGGDPVEQSDEDCNIYAASLNYGPDPFGEGRNAIGLYRTTPKILANCPAGEDPDKLTRPSCWPVRRAVAFADVAGGVGNFLDKEWMDVGRSGAAGNVVWVTYSDFASDVNAPLGFTGAEIKAVRCTANLKSCTEPILISGADEDIQFSASPGLRSRVSSRRPRRRSRSRPASPRRAAPISAPPGSWLGRRTRSRSQGSCTPTTSEWPPTRSRSCPRLEAPRHPSSSTTAAGSDSWTTSARSPRS